MAAVGSTTATVSTVHWLPAGAPMAARSASDVLPKSVSICRPVGIESCAKADRGRDDQHFEGTVSQAVGTHPAGAGAFGARGSACLVGAPLGIDGARREIRGIDARLSGPFANRVSNALARGWRHRGAARLMRPAGNRCAQGEAAVGSPDAALQTSRVAGGLAQRAAILAGRRAGRRRCHS